MQHSSRVGPVDSSRVAGPPMVMQINKLQRDTNVLVAPPVIVDLGDTFVKPNYLIPIALGALLFGSAIANAQTSPNSPAGPTAAAPNTNQADVTKGNDLVDSSQAVPTTRRDNPRSDGEDKANGNDLVSPEKAGIKQAMATRPSFNSLDTQKKGSLTADDVKGNKRLSKNFSRCDTDHDGTLDRKEYSACK